MSEERINCIECGADTNHCPPEFPPDWDGHCPACAVIKSLTGKLSPSPHTAELVASAFMNAIASGKVAIMDGTQVVASDETGTTFMSRRSLN